MSKNNGGTAFPVQSVYVEDQETNSCGMTLRDYFAAKALQGFLAYPEVFQDTGEGVSMAYAREAYNYADSMLKARQ